MVLVLNKGYCYIKRKSWFCFPFSPDVSLDFISDHLGKHQDSWERGIVSCRVALLQRSSEIKPLF